MAELFTIYGAGFCSGFGIAIILCMALVARGAGRVTQ